MFQGTMAATTPTGSLRSEDVLAEEARPRSPPTAWFAATSAKAPSIAHGSVAWASFENEIGDAHLVGDELRHLLAPWRVELGQPPHGVDPLGRVEPRPGPVVDGGAGGGHGPVDVRGPAAATVAMSSSVCGETTSMHGAVLGATHSPPMNSAESPGALRRECTRLALH